MTINFDTSGLEQLLYLPADVLIWRLLFWYFGWLVICIVMFIGIIEAWSRMRHETWEDKQKFVLLAIDIPRNNAQSPRAVENLFTYFAGAHASKSMIENYWKGEHQLVFSFEIVSIEGFIQFLIWTPEKFRHLTESAIYSQYPDAEVYEVEDYTKGAPSHFPDDEYDIWGAEFIQVRNSMLPIRTYPEFEHKFGEPEVQYKDPMASLMDVMSSLQKGEQLWYQVVILPCNQEWVHEKDHLISKILKEKLPATKANNFVDGILKWMGAVSESIYQLWGDIEEKEKKPDDPLRMINLKPGVKKQVEGAELKASKLGFETKIRAIYISRKEILNKQKVVSGFVGFIKQFNTNDLNALKPDTKVTMTKALYFFTKYRLNRKKWKIMRAYKGRSDNKGRKMWLMNVEELASIWHFPIDAVVKMPLVQRAGARRVEPPMSLPFDDGPKKMSANREPIFDDDFEIEPASVAEKNSEANLEKTMPHEPKFMEEETNEPVEELAVPSPKRGEAPPNLPFVD